MKRTGLLRDHASSHPGQTLQSAQLAVSPTVAQHLPPWSPCSPSRSLSIIEGCESPWLAGWLACWMPLRCGERPISKMAIGQGRHGWGMRTGNHLETPDDAFVISHDGSRQGREGIPGDERGANIPMLQPACAGGSPRHPTHGARLCRHSLRLTRPVAAAVLALRGASLFSRLNLSSTLCVRYQASATNLGLAHAT